MFSRTSASTYTASTGAAAAAAAPPASPPPSARGRRLTGPGRAPPAYSQGWTCRTSPWCLQGRTPGAPGSQTWWWRLTLIRMRLEIRAASRGGGAVPLWMRFKFELKKIMMMIRWDSPETNAHFLFPSEKLLACFPADWAPPAETHGA